MYVPRNVTHLESDMATVQIEKKSRTALVW